MNTGWERRPLNGALNFCVLQAFPLDEQRVRDATEDLPEGLASHAKPGTGHVLNALINH